MSEEFYYENSFESYSQNIHNNSNLFFVKEKILKIIQIQQILDDLLSYPNDDLILNKISGEIKSYIACNCIHEWVDDLIDIDLDNSINITYCEICSQTMESNIETPPRLQKKS